MADQQNSVATGILGHLPPWPRSALNNSVIAAEQAYRHARSAGHPYAHPFRFRLDLALASAEGGDAADGSALARTAGSF